MVKSKIKIIFCVLLGTCLIGASEAKADVIVSSVSGDDGLVCVSYECTKCQHSISYGSNTRCLREYIDICTACWYEETAM
jgi:hypothetical protein